MPVVSFFETSVVVLSVRPTRRLFWMLAVLCQCFETQVFSFTTRMHSSRMHTACSLTISCSICWGRVQWWARQLCPLPCMPSAMHVPLPCMPPAMHVPLPCMPPAMHAPLPCMPPTMHAPCHTPPCHACPPVDRQKPVKTKPSQIWAYYWYESF